MNIAFKDGIAHKNSIFIETNFRSNRYKVIVKKSDTAGLLFSKRTDILPQDLVKFQSREIRCSKDGIALIFDNHLGCCRGVCKMSERLEKSNPKSRSFET